MHSTFLKGNPVNMMNTDSVLLKYRMVSFFSFYNQSLKINLITRLFPASLQRKCSGTRFPVRVANQEWLWLFFRQALDHLTIFSFLEFKAFLPISVSILLILFLLSFILFIYLFFSTAIHCVRMLLVWNWVRHITRPYVIWSISLTVTPR